MKLTTSKLKEMIREEIQSVKSEGLADRVRSRAMGAYSAPSPAATKPPIPQSTASKEDPYWKHKKYLVGYPPGKQDYYEKLETTAAEILAKKLRDLIFSEDKPEKNNIGKGIEGLAAKVQTHFGAEGNPHQKASLSEAILDWVLEMWEELEQNDKHQSPPTAKSMRYGMDWPKPEHLDDLKGRISQVMGRYAR